MGVDIYLYWEGITGEEMWAQHSVRFSYEHGHTGYLRETNQDPNRILDEIFGTNIESLSEHYATKFLCREVFEKEPGKFLYISSKKLAKMLPRTMKIAKERGLKAYDEFVKKIESLSGPYATKFLCREAFEKKSDKFPYISSKTLRKRLPHTIEIVKERRLKAYDEVVEENHPVIKSFIDFVELAERLEREGKEIRILLQIGRHNKKCPFGR